MFSLALAALLLQASSPLELRTVTVVATDAKGAPVRGLTAADAVVLENGVAREVVELSLDSRPLTLAILVDTSAPMATPFRLTVAGAVAQFLNRLPEGTRFAIWTTGDRPSKVADFGTDPAQASRALARAFPTGGNTLLDALVEASQDLSKREGERSAHRRRRTAARHRDLGDRRQRRDRRGRLSRSRALRPPPPRCRRGGIPHLCAGHAIGAGAGRDPEHRDASA